MWEGKPNPCRFLPSLLSSTCRCNSRNYFSSFAMHPDYATTITLWISLLIILIIPHKARASPTSLASLKFFSTRSIFPMKNDSIPQKVFDRYWHHNKNWYVDILHDNYDICIALCLWLLHGFCNFMRLISCKIFCIDCWFRLNWGES